MDEIELDERQTGFIAGWLIGRGIDRRPSLDEFAAALRALVEAGLLPEAQNGEEYAAIRLH
ncbi:MAG: hypothetical protein ABW136_09900 [Steroidobacteraceae bacterium]